MASETKKFLSVSERRAFTRCRFHWYFPYEARVKPKVDAPPLRFGRLVHKAMELRYPPGTKRGPKPAETFEQLYEKELIQVGKDGFRDEDGVWHEMGELGVSMLEHYLEVYGADEAVKVIAAEQKFQVPIKGKSGATVGWAVGVIDQVYEWRPTGGIRMRDWKTAKQIKTNYLSLDEQSGYYWTYGNDWLISKKIIKPGTHIQGIEFDFLRKAVKDTRKQNELGQYLNQDGSVSKVQPSKYFHRELVYRDEADRDAVRQRTVAQLREIMLVHAGKLEIYKAPGEFTCMGCPWQGPCELHETGNDWEEMVRLTTSTRGGWKDILTEDIESEYEH